MNKKLLLVEDDPDLVKLLKYNFENEGYVFLSATTGERGLDIARDQRPDIILLDVMLPKMSGFDFCRILRKSSQVPIIFLTAKKTEVDRIMGLKLGGDDFVSKPFSIGEVLARVEANLRRAAPRRAEAGAAPRVRDLEVDISGRTARVKGKPVSLSPREFDILVLLLEAKGNVISRRSLLERLWGQARAMELDTRCVDQHVSRLRKKLGLEGKRIVTATSAGYRIV